MKHIKVVTARGGGAVALSLRARIHQLSSIPHSPNVCCWAIDASAFGATPHRAASPTTSSVGAVVMAVVVTAIVAACLPVMMDRGRMQAWRCNGQRGPGRILLWLRRSRTGRFGRCSSRSGGSDRCAPLPAATQRVVRGMNKVACIGTSTASARRATALAARPCTSGSPSAAARCWGTVVEGR
jgi:hypothetical protein